MITAVLNMDAATGVAFLEGFGGVWSTAVPGISAHCQGTRTRYQLLFIFCSFLPSEILTEL